MRSCSVRTATRRRQIPPGSISNLRLPCTRMVVGGVEWLHTVPPVASRSRGELVFARPAVSPLPSLGWLALPDLTGRAFRCGRALEGNLPAYVRGYPINMVGT